MNWLLEQLPDKVLVNGVEYPINADFRTIILIDQIMHDKELSDTDRILSALNIFYMDKAPEQTTQAFLLPVWSVLVLSLWKRARRAGKAQRTFSETY